jgi:DNA-directed RNA polymerase specialized sigma24 family protein
MPVSGLQEQVEQKELCVISWGAVWTMPEHLRRVITHLYICDRSLEDTATLLDLDLDMLVYLHHKALENLRARISNDVTKCRRISLPC